MGTEHLVSMIKMFNLVKVKLEIVGRLPNAHIESSANITLLENAYGADVCLALYEKKRKKKSGLPHILLSSSCETELEII